jgi:two-component system sensor histidine kinase YesM
MNGNSYRTYIRNSFTRYALSTILILFVFVALFFTFNLFVLSNISNQKNNEKLTALLDDQAENYSRSLEHFSENASIREALWQQDSQSVTSANYALYDFANSQTIRCTFSLVSAADQIVCSNLYGGNRKIFLESQVYRDMVSRLKSQPDRVFVLPSGLNYSSRQTGSLLFGHAITQEGVLLGYLFFDMSDLELYEAVKVFPVDDLILTDRFDNLIFTLGRPNSDPMQKYPSGKYRMDWQNGNTVRLNDKEYNIHQGTFFHGDLILYTLISIEYQKLLTTYSIIFLILAGILMFVLLIPITKRTTKKHLKAVNELMASVEELGKGNMDYKLSAQVFDEFQMLNDSFRNIVIQREALLKHNTELTQRKRILEITQLEEQFNPHFIFNVMETLRYEILIDTNVASDMVTALASLMRYSINNGSTAVTLQTDMEYINDYLLLQKMRYNRRLTYHMDIPEELTGCRIPKLLIQPVVENALVHGMKDLPNISVAIAAAEKDGCLVLTVQDNGVGIEPELLASIRQHLDTEDILREHIGLHNTHRMVQLLYGPSYGLRIESSPGNGTLVTVVLPIIQEEE